MLFILIALILVAVISIALLKFGDDGYEWQHTIMAILGMVFLILDAVACFLYAILGYSWLAAQTKADILNREYGTHYTREEVFYGSDVIDTIRQLDRKRIEINGDLLRDKQDK